MVAYIVCHISNRRYVLCKYRTARSLDTIVFALGFKFVTCDIFLYGISSINSYRAFTLLLRKSCVFEDITYSHMFSYTNLLTCPNSKA